MLGTELEGVHLLRARVPMHQPALEVPSLPIVKTMVKTVKYKSPPRQPRRLPVASLQRWQAACDALSARGDAGVYRQLISAWRARSRHYHGVNHLEACLREFEIARAVIQEPGAVELALWFHDAIYRTYRRDNEQRSATWAEEALAKLGVSPEVGARIGTYVLATRHGAEALTGDAAFVVDIDLSILGESAELYDEFERQIRREYWWVGRKRFARARITVLDSFLARPSVYHTSLFRERYEDKARGNLTRALTNLQQLL
jgi:predicted metal-dependent HD superfamily phosphohydrolase